MSIYKTDKQFKIKALIVFVGVIFFGTLAYIGSGSPIEKTNQSFNSPVVNMGAVEKMSLAFEGDYSQKEISERITKAMTLYNTPITEENLSRAGSALVALRQEYGVNEMDILDYMIRSYVEDTNINFQSMAGIAVSFLVTGDK